MHTRARTASNDALTTDFAHHVSTQCSLESLFLPDSTPLECAPYSIERNGWTMDRAPLVSHLEDLALGS
eukprot:2174127-Alexandrium_andersonii.AAC.1